MFYEWPGRNPAWRVGVPLAVRGQLSAIAQIYLQSSPIFGTVLLLCLYLTQPVLALGCLVGACVASAMAWALAFPDGDRRQGRYSFNAALSGAGLCAGYQFSSALVAWIVVLAVLTALLSRVAQRAGIPVLTSLFVAAMWLTDACAPLLGLRSAAQVAAIPACSLAPSSFLFCTLGQVSFVGPAALGVLVWAALARHSRQLALWMLYGAALAWCVASSAEWVLNWPVVSSQSTGMGINSALTALALATFERSRSQRLLGPALSILLCLALAATGLAYFTAPFVLATWLLLSARGRWRWKVSGE
ncbi:urea transporter [Duganella violaceipulchra]|uniref:Urea transporter n=1 Tax=Duganella violaceipulchra TaxID=2849652 RepID=A0AA41L8A4_9BURK|nr:urea transporter [Duganella violaceicalia]MBV6322030.1 urea transporter [Duganella violaceicalia]MCP2006973.1 urea transporter [Duganella violaceicalia]